MWKSKFSALNCKFEMCYQLGRSNKLLEQSQLLEMDQPSSRRRPFIDRNTVSEVKRIHGKNGTFTQRIMTTFVAYDDPSSVTPSMNSLPSIPCDAEQSVAVEESSNQITKRRVEL